MVYCQPLQTVRIVRTEATCGALKTYTGAGEIRKVTRSKRKTILLEITSYVVFLG
jgi:hypothetical protein